MHGGSSREETWLGRTNWLWLVVNGLSTGVWRLIGWMSRKCPRHLTPGGLGAVLVIAAAIVAAVGLATSPDGMAGLLTAQAAGVLLTAALADLVVVTYARTALRRRRRHDMAQVRVIPRPEELAGRHRMMLVNDGDGPMIDTRISVHITRDRVTYRVWERPRVAPTSSAGFDVINNDVAGHLPFESDDELVAEWMDRRGEDHSRRWRLGDHLFWGYPVAFDPDGIDSRTALTVRSR